MKISRPTASPRQTVAKLIIPYDNAIVSVASGRVQLTRANRMNFVGNRDSATLIRTSPHRTGFIAIEFRPQGAFSIFGVPMSATSNRLWETDDVFGPWSRAVEDRINNVDRVGEKVARIERELTLLVRKNLERETGYSRRYLDRLFQQHVGLSPKVLAEIFRFQRFYRKRQRIRAPARAPAAVANLMGGVEFPFLQYGARPNVQNVDL
jgi:hypothetical protein